MQSLKVNLNLLLNNQKHNQNNFCKKQSLNLQLNKVFGDMLTFCTFIFKCYDFEQIYSPACAQQQNISVLSENRAEKLGGFKGVLRELYTWMYELY